MHSLSLAIVSLVPCIHHPHTTRTRQLIVTSDDPDTLTVSHVLHVSCSCQKTDGSPMSQYLAFTTSEKCNSFKQLDVMCEYVLCVHMYKGECERERERNLLKYQGLMRHGFEKS